MFLNFGVIFAQIDQPNIFPVSTSPKKAPMDKTEREPLLVSSNTAGNRSIEKIASNAEEEPSKQMKRLDRLAWLLDESIRLPGGYRIGLDSLVGLIPGIGDGVGAITSSYVLIEGYRAGAPRSVMARMVVNVLVEALVGVVPVLGDLFDMAWKSNSRNVALLQRHTAKPREVQRFSRTYLVVALVILLAGLAATVAATILLARFIFDLF